MQMKNDVDSIALNLEILNQIIEQVHSVLVSFVVFVIANLLQQSYMDIFFPKILQESNFRDCNDIEE